MIRDTRRREIKRLGPWWHQIDLGNGIRTRDIAPQWIETLPRDYPSLLWEKIRPSIPDDLRGMRILDLGCSDGFFSVELAKRGAAKVIAMDPVPNRVRNVAFVAKTLELPQIEARVGSIYDLPPEERYDWVLMLGVLYHLPHPLLGLERVAAVTNHMILETCLLQDERSMLAWGPEQGVSDGWIPSHRCVLDMLQSVGFRNSYRIQDHRTARAAYVCAR